MAENDIQLACHRKGGIDQADGWRKKLPKQRFEQGVMRTTQNDRFDGGLQQRLEVTHRNSTEIITQQVARFDQGNKGRTGLFNHQCSRAECFDAHAVRR